VIDWTWTGPGRLEPDVLGEEPGKLPLAAAVVRMEDDDRGPRSSAYRIGDEETYLFAEDGRITHVEFSDRLMIAGRDVIDAPEEEIIALVAARCGSPERGDGHVEWRECGLTMWFEDGLVESVMVFRPASRSA